MRRPALLLLALLSGGCTLIDQRTFNPAAGVAIQPPAPPSNAVPPLLVINVGGAGGVDTDVLRQGVRAALARKPTVEFDVVSVVPATGTPAQQVAAATGITGDARDVAHAIAAEGVDDSRIHLSALAEAWVTGRQIRVLVH